LSHEKKKKLNSINNYIIIIIIILWTKQLVATLVDALGYNVQWNAKMALNGTHIRNMKEGNVA
jgi:hypothetical protein